MLAKQRLILAARGVIDLGARAAEGFRQHVMRRSTCCNAQVRSPRAMSRRQTAAIEEFAIRGNLQLLIAVC